MHNHDFFVTEIISLRYTSKRVTDNLDTGWCAIVSNADVTRARYVIDD